MAGSHKASVSRRVLERGAPTGEEIPLEGASWACAAHVLYACSMSKMIQIRDVPEQVHRTLKARAASEGMSLSELIKRELKQAVERPTMREWLKRTEQARPISNKGSAARVLRELRDA